MATATTIKRRVAHLERRLGGDECPECGLGPEDDKKPIEVAWGDPEDETFDEWCQRCGRWLVISIDTDL